jgi:hypothetical protein
MKRRTRPRSHGERMECCRAIKAYRASATDADAKASDARIFKPTQESWEAAFAAHRTAIAAYEAASTAADDADDAFDPAVTEWVSTVRDAKKKSLSEALTAFAGGHTMSSLCELPYEKEVTQFRDFFARLDGRPDLQGDATCLARVKAALDGLEPAAGAQSAARRTRVARGDDLEKLCGTFDVAYCKLVRNFRSILGDTATFEILPTWWDDPGTLVTPPAADPAPVVETPKE